MIRVSMVLLGTRRLLLRPRTAARCLELLLWLAAAGLCLRLVSIRRLLPALGKATPLADRSPLGTVALDTPGDRGDPSTQAHVVNVRQALRAVERVMLSPPKCLCQAMASMWMLRRRGVPSCLTLAVAADGSQRAHAVLQVGSRYVCGERGLRDDPFVPLCRVHWPGAGESVSLR